MKELSDKDQFSVGSKTLHSFTNRLDNTSKLVQQIIWFTFFTFMLRSMIKNFLRRGGSSSSSGDLGGLGPESGILKSKAKKFTLESNIKVKTFLKKNIYY